jgi:hypothetical protein
LRNPAEIRLGPVQGAPEAMDADFHGPIPEGAITPENGYSKISLAPETPNFKAGFRFSGSNGRFAIRFLETDILMEESFSTPEGEYPVGPAEIFKGPDYFEAEVLAPQETIAPSRATAPLTIGFHLSHIA